MTPPVTVEHTLEPVNQVRDALKGLALPPVIQAMVDSGMGAEELTWRITGRAIQGLRRGETKK